MNYFGCMPQNQYFDVWTDDRVFNEFKKHKAAELKDMDFTGKTNYYFTPNSITFLKKNGKWTIKRDTKHLDHLNALYVDIDIDPADGLEPETVLKAIKHHNSEEMPQPSIVVNSGHGLHLYWLIESIPAFKDDNLVKWKAVQNYLYEVLKSYGADRMVVNDPVRLLRIPRTINQKDRQPAVKCYVIESNYIKYNLDSIIDEYSVEIKKKPLRKQSTKTKEANKNLQKQNNEQRSEKAWSIYIPLFAKRLNDLATLLINYRDFENSGRESILFIYRYTALEFCHDKDKALQMTLDLNRKLKHPLKEREVINATASAEKYHKGSGLKWTNEYIVNWLRISEEEQLDMEVLIGQKLREEKRAEINKSYYNHILEKNHKLTREQQLEDKCSILYELKKQGLNRQQICLKMNISMSAYYKYSKIVKDEAWIVEYENAVNIRQESFSD